MERLNFFTFSRIIKAPIPNDNVYEFYGTSDGFYALERALFPCFFDIIKLIKVVKFQEVCNIFVEFPRIILENT